MVKFQTSSYKAQTLAQDTEKTPLKLIKGMKLQLTQEGPLVVVSPNNGAVAMLDCFASLPNADNVTVV